MKLLHFEDDLFLGEMYRVHFEARGFDYVRYDSIPEDLIETVRRECPDLIIMGIILGQGLDGYEATKMLKENTATMAVPILGLDNLGQPEDIAKALHVGMNDYVVAASVTPRELVRKVKNILGLSIERSDYEESRDDLISSEPKPAVHVPSFFDLPLDEEKRTKNINRFANNLIRMTTRLFASREDGERAREPYLIPSLVIFAFTYIMIGLDSESIRTFFLKAIQTTSVSLLITLVLAILLEPTQKSKNRFPIFLFWAVISMVIVFVE